MDMLLYTDARPCYNSFAKYKKKQSCSADSIPKGGGQENFHEV